METRGRRTARAAEPTAPADPVDPIALDAAPSQPAEVPSEPPQPDEIDAEAAETMETALDVVTSSVAGAGQALINPRAPETGHAAPDSFSALARSQVALEAISAEMAGMALSGIDSSARTASEMLSFKTFSQLIALNAGLACTGLDTLIGGSARLSELGVKLASETSQSLLTQLGNNWLLSGRAAG